MKLCLPLLDLHYQMEKYCHGRQVRDFDKKLQANEHGGGVSHSLINVSQGRMRSLFNAVVSKPSASFVYALMASRLAGVGAYSADSGEAMYKAIGACMLEPRTDDSYQPYAVASCLGRIANDVCSGRKPGDGSRYNQVVHHDETNEAQQSVCRQLLARSAGINTNIMSANKTPADIVHDIKKDVLESAYYKKNLEDDSLGIIGIYDLYSQVDGDIVDKSDVSDWLSRHRYKLEAEGLARPPSVDDFIHAADNRYKETGDIRDHRTYQRVLHALYDLEMESYKANYYGDLTTMISEKLVV